MAPSTTIPANHSRRELWARGRALVRAIGDALLLRVRRPGRVVPRVRPTGSGAGSRRRNPRA